MEITTALAVVAVVAGVLIVVNQDGGTTTPAALHAANMINASPTVGSGPAVVLRDGQRFTGTWSRPATQSPTTFHTVNGQELPLAPGPVWALLTPT